MNDEYISVQDACQLLNCGRTKIYTHYISKGLLTIRRKLGNRSFFMRTDVEELLKREIGENQNPLPMAQSSANSLTQPPEPTENTNSAQILFPSRTASQDTTVTDYISTLKSRIHELEQTISENNQLINQYKSQVLNSIPLLEYNQKLTAKEQEAQETRRLLEFSEQRVQHLEIKTSEVGSLAENLQLKFNQSLQIALSYKNALQTEQSKRVELDALIARMKELLQELESCRFYEWGRKKMLREEVQKIAQAIKRQSLT